MQPAPLAPSESQLDPLVLGQFLFGMLTPITYLLLAEPAPLVALIQIVAVTVHPQLRWQLELLLPVMLELLVAGNQHLLCQATRHPDLLFLTFLEFLIFLLTAHFLVTNKAGPQLFL